MIRGASVSPTLVVDTVPADYVVNTARDRIIYLQSQSPLESFNKEGEALTPLRDIWQVVRPVILVIGLVVMDSSWRRIRKFPGLGAGGLTSTSEILQAPVHLAGRHVAEPDSVCLLASSTFQPGLRT